jgi:hypothetical protein
MSYSFSVRAANKTAAKAAVAAKFAEIVRDQPVHARDNAAVLKNASTVIDLLADDDGKDIIVNCNGYVSWSDGAGTSDAKFSSASVACAANHALRE